MIKVAHIQVLPILSGVQKVSMQIFENLDKNKYQMYLICAPEFNGNRALIDAAENLGVECITVPSLKREIGIYDIAAFLDLYKICRKYKFDIVHTHSSKPGFLGRIAAKLAGVSKVIHTVHGLPYHEYSSTISRFFYSNLERFAAFFSNYVVFVNNSERNMCLTEKIISAKQAITIYNGIVLDQTFTRSATISEQLFIGSVSRFSPQKNIVETIKSAIDVCLSVENVKFEFVGHGELFEVCKSLVDENGLAERILLPGWQSDIPERLKNYNLFLLYSKWEGLPLAILEAMAYQLPIIASDIKGNNELVDDSNGWLVDVNDNSVLTQKLIALCKDQSELINKGYASLEKVKTHFSFDAFIQQHEHLYEK